MSKRIWSRTAENAIEFLHVAGWSWSAIAAHVSGIEGRHVTYDACRKKGYAIGVTLLRNRQGYKRIDGLQDDLHDMMLLDYTSKRMVEEIKTQHGIDVSRYWVCKELKRIGGPAYGCWKGRAYQRRSRLLRGRAAA